MDLTYIFNVFMCIIYAASFRVTADSSEDDSCEDSNSSDYETFCERYLVLARCRNNFGPVCGSNGITYRSEYQLAISACSHRRDNPSIQVTRRGSCRRIPRPPVVPVRPPPPARDPCAFRCLSGQPFVCGSDGVVYESRCHLRRVNCYRNMGITVRNEGFCVSESSPTTPAPAIKVTTPVATTSQATTPVIVTVRTTQLPVVTTELTTPAITRRTPRDFGGNNTPQPGRGDTPCNDNCPAGPADGSATVCGSNGETYETECLLLVKQCQEDRNLVVSSRGPCPLSQSQRQCPPTSICPREYLPICGTGNITYPSLCHFQIAACKAKDDTRKVLLAGECPLNSLSSCPTCPPEINEVCGTDNMTYTSECVLSEISCRYNLPDLMVAHLGQCLNQECPDTCVNVMDPVCANNGKTYSSLCALSVETCKDKESPITVAYRGRCSGDFCDVVCPDIYEPLCDNKGTTYQNACQLWIAICRDPGLTKKLDQEGCNLAIP
ncbi:serine protease inhibitor dipetalogastin isoform X1 [Strongylocentrotus purpuratus]|uniref:Kazal-like domain-containing protein n=1 Tax=Strongylocentrotus purpuratus TaxID=7668 RepID=A0A7M7LU02_STRPU|nr:serine protease inhibitor dipetalogastin isoform X1 [Strongylocentrotus purpuratus]XP_030828528.1 serine protease inhibitor dipetalogastin isoform X1 [Strongylocentrotus purpuratus]